MALRSFLTVAMVLGMAIPASALVLTLAQDTFGPQEDIEVLAHNESNLLVSFPSSAPFIARNLETDEIITFIGLAVIIPLQPGAQKSFVIHGGVLHPGRWELEFRYWENEERMRSSSIVFTIRESDSSPTPHGSMGRLKDRYRG